MTERGERGESPWGGFAPEFLTDLFRNPLEPGYADAARRRARHGAGAGPPEPAWQRAAARTLTLLVLAGIGFLLVVAYLHVLAEEPDRIRTRAGLVGEINDRQRTTDDLGGRAERLRAEVARLRDAALDDSAAARLRNLEAITGLARVTGDGVVVRISDAPRAVDAVTGAGGVADQGRVLDRDLQQIANALWMAGAEAIAINGQRLISTSTIRAAGDAILVDYRPVAGPYEVAAIGPEELRRRFSDSPTAGAFRDLAAAFGMSFEVREQDDLDLPAASEPQLRYARPVLPSPAPSGSPAVPTASPSKGGR